MPLLINFKICDNAEECNGIASCPTGALSWDSKKKTIKIDNSKCVSCGVCVPTCMVGAIKVAKNEKEYSKLKKEIDADKRKVSDLFTDRYGAQPLHKAFLIDEDKFEKEVLHYHKIAVAELFNENSIICLYCSIPIKELFDGKNIKYRKVGLEGNSLLKQFDVSKLPALLFFNDGKLIGKIEGAFEPEKKAEIDSKIKSILK
ncbi:Sulfite reductase, dissimilatory-type subunit beta [uncultured archaeon]|nr:Sulfite reductase, dissimilatory-type subunit beta [uncultured archaeon]